MKIDPLTAEDIPSVIALVHRNWDEVMAGHHSAEVVARFRNELTPEVLKRQQDWKHILVVRAEEQVVATGAVANFGSGDTPRYCVSQFFVQPERHGQGIGTALLHRLLAFLREQGATVCHVPSSRNAIGFYGTFGFVVDDSQPDAADEITWMTRML